MFEEWKERRKQDAQLAYPKVDMETDKDLLELYRIAASEEVEDHDAMVFATKTEYDWTDEEACHRVVERLIWLGGARLEGSIYSESDLADCVIPFESLKEYMAFAGDNPNETIVASLKARWRKQFDMPVRPCSYLRKTISHAGPYDAITRINKEGQLVYVPETNIGELVVRIVKKQFKHDRYPYTTCGDLRRDYDRRIQAPFFGDPLTNFLLFLFGLSILGMIADIIYG